jgi:hypothetical protein
MNRPQFVSFLIFFWALAPMAGSHAQALKTQDWKIWNNRSQTVFPQENWLRYATPEEAGWRFSAPAHTAFVRPCTSSRRALDSQGISL